MKSANLRIPDRTSVYDSTNSGKPYKEKVEVFVVWKFLLSHARVDLQTIRREWDDRWTSSYFVWKTNYYKDSSKKQQFALVPGFVANIAAALA